MGLPFLANPPRHFQYYRNVAPEFTSAAPREKNYNWHTVWSTRNGLRRSDLGVAVQYWVSDKGNLQLRNTLRVPLFFEGERAEEQIIVLSQIIDPVFTRCPHLG